jgi:hypothetical protein
LALALGLGYRRWWHLMIRRCPAKRTAMRRCAPEEWTRLESPGSGEGADDVELGYGGARLGAGMRWHGRAVEYGDGDRKAVAGGSDELRTTRSVGRPVAAGAVLYPVQSDRRAPPRSANRWAARGDSAVARRVPPAAAFPIKINPEFNFSRGKNRWKWNKNPGKFVEVRNQI